jgi:UDP-N-acetylglucosamine kinase
MPDELDPSEHNKIFKEKIVPQQLDHIQPVKKPTLFMLGGQPGAGKTKVRDAIKGSEQGKGSLIIDIDELRTYHPKYLEFVEEDPNTAAGRVQKDASAWASGLSTAALEKKVNMIYDGTLSNPVPVTAMAKAAHDSGHKIEVHVIATPLEVSQQGVRGRYEKALKAYNDNPEESAPPRNVPENIQNEAYNYIPATLNALCTQNLVSRIRISNRNGDELSNVIAKKGKLPADAAKSATAALDKERKRTWTDEEVAAFYVNGKEIEESMEARLGAQDQELANIKQKHAQKVDKDTLRKVQDSWIQRNLGVAVSAV